MAFISVSDELKKKSFTDVENKFITKYLPVLESEAVKVYLYALYVYQSGLASFTALDFSKALNMPEEKINGYFEYLEEFELVSILCRNPLEIKICDCENVYGAPKKYKPEKYADFTKNVQNIIKGRMISTNEFMEYFYLMEEYGFDQNALIMIITYCVNLKGDDIRLAYIKKVAKNFAAEGVTTAAKVDEKLSAYSSSSPALMKLFAALGINRRPDIDDDKLYKKWTEEMEFSEEAVIAASKFFKAKSVEKIDSALSELYKNRKFDVKEIEDYCKNKNSVYSATLEIARALGVYMQNPAPYVENYANVWFNYGYDAKTLKALASYCFMHGRNSFEAMNDFVKQLYDDGIITEESVGEYISTRNEEDKLIKQILTTGGLTRKIINWDRECLSRWKTWGFNDEMLLEAAKIASGKSNPMAYMNGVLSSWKSENVFTKDKIPMQYATISTPSVKNGKSIDKAAIERHYSDLRHFAEEQAEAALKKATADPVYGELYRQINSLNIKLAFAEIRDKNQAAAIARDIAALEEKADSRLSSLGIDKKKFIPDYKCKICNDTGFDANGKQCKCLKEFIKNNS